MVLWFWASLAPLSMHTINTALILQTLGTCDCLTGRVRFMTAITFAYAHAYQTICLAMDFTSVPHRTFHFPGPNPGIHIFPTIVSLQEN